jgi:phosphate:Na+ symporter
MMMLGCIGCEWQLRFDDTEVAIERYVRIQSLYLTTGDFSALQQMNTVVGGRNSENNADATYRIEEQINTLRAQLKDDNILMANERQFDYAVGTMFVDFINECEKLGDYVVNVVEARLGS